MKSFRVIIVIALLLWGCRFVCAAEPIAFVLCGGNGKPNEFPATVRWENYAEAAIAIGPQVKAAGLRRVFYHNPGGHFYLGWTPNPADVHDPLMIAAAKAAKIDTREMHCNQWLLAEQAGLRFADRKRLRIGHQLLREHYGVAEVIYYVGSPSVLQNVDRDAIVCVEMFTACGEGVSLGFDATAWDWANVKPGDAVCEFFAKLRKQGVKVYVEPRLNKAQVDAGLGKWIDGTIATADFDTGPHFKPDLAIQPGETMRGPVLPTDKLPAGVTPLLADAKGLNWTKGAK